MGFVYIYTQWMLGKAHIKKPKKEMNRIMAQQKRMSKYDGGLKNPTYYDMKYASSSPIFESEDIIKNKIGPQELQKAEDLYYDTVEKLKNGEELGEGLLGALAGGAIGALVGPAIGKAICKVLGITEQGHLGKLLTSRLVTTAMGIALGK